MSGQNIETVETTLHDRYGNLIASKDLTGITVSLSLLGSSLLTIKPIATSIRLNSAVSVDFKVMQVCQGCYLDFGIESNDVAVESEGNPVSVDVYELPLATIRRASISDSGSFLLLEFSTAITLAPMIACAEIFDASTARKLGEDPTCEFASEQELLIRMDVSATLQPFDVMSTLPAAFVAVQNGTVVPEQSIIIVQPRNPLQPKVAIRSPSVICACDPLVLSAEVGFGSGGRPLDFNWGLNLGPTSASELLVLLRSADAQQVVIPTGALQAGQSYTFTLRAINWLGRESSTFKRILVTGDRVPISLIVGSPEVTTPGGVPFVLKVDVDHTTDLGIPLSFRWQQISGIPLPQLVQAVNRSNQVLLTTSELQQGTSILIRLEVSSAMTGRVLSSDTIRINFIHQPLRVWIAGGDRQIPRSSQVVLDASSMVQPEVLASLEFVWRCMTEDGTACLPPQSEVQQQLKSTDTVMITIPPNTLPIGRYTFTLTVGAEPGPRTDTTSVTISTVSGAVPIVLLAPTALILANSAGWLVVSSSVQAQQECESQNYNWLACAAAQPGLEPCLLGEDGFEPVTDQKSIIVRPFPRTMATAYTIRLDVRCGQQIGWAELKMPVYSVPTKGIMAVTPLHGIATQTTFTFQFRSFIAPEDSYPLLFEVCQMVSNVSRYCVSQGSQNELQTRLLASEGNFTAVRGSVSTVEGAVVYVDRTLHVSAHAADAAILSSSDANVVGVLANLSQDMRNALVGFENSADPQGIRQVIAATCSVLNQMALASNPVQVRRLSTSHSSDSPTPALLEEDFNFSKTNRRHLIETSRRSESHQAALQLAQSEIRGFALRALRMAFGMAALTRTETEAFATSLSVILGPVDEAQLEALSSAIVLAVDIADAIVEGRHLLGSSHLHALLDAVGKASLLQTRDVAVAGRLRQTTSALVTSQMQYFVAGQTPLLVRTGSAAIYASKVSAASLKDIHSPVCLDQTYTAGSLCIEPRFPSLDMTTDVIVDVVVWRKAFPRRGNESTNVTVGPMMSMDVLQASNFRPVTWDAHAVFSAVFAVDQPPENSIARCTTSAGPEEGFTSMGVVAQQISSMAVKCLILDHPRTVAIFYDSADAAQADIAADIGFASLAEWIDYARSVSVTINLLVTITAIVVFVGFFTQALSALLKATMQSWGVINVIRIPQIHIPEMAEDADSYLSVLMCRHPLLSLFVSLPMDQAGFCARFGCFGASVLAIMELNMYGLVFEGFDSRERFDMAILVGLGVLPVYYLFLLPFAVSKALRRTSDEDQRFEPPARLTAKSLDKLAELDPSDEDKVSAWTNQQQDLPSPAAHSTFLIDDPTLDSLSAAASPTNPHFPGASMARPSHRSPLPLATATPHPSPRAAMDPIAFAHPLDPNALAGRLFPMAEAHNPDAVLSFSDLQSPARGLGQLPGRRRPSHSSPVAASLPLHRPPPVCLPDDTSLLPNSVLTQRLEESNPARTGPVQVSGGRFGGETSEPEYRDEDILFPPPPPPSPRAEGIRHSPNLDLSGASSSPAAENEELSRTKPAHLGDASEPVIDGLLEPEVGDDEMSTWHAADSVPFRGTLADEQLAGSGAPQDAGAGVLSPAQQRRPRTLPPLSSAVNTLSPVQPAHPTPLRDGSLVQQAHANLSQHRSESDDERSIGDDAAADELEGVQVQDGFDRQPSMGRVECLSSALETSRATLVVIGAEIVTFSWNSLKVATALVILLGPATNLALHLGICWMSAEAVGPWMRKEMEQDWMEACIVGIIWWLSLHAVCIVIVVRSMRWWRDHAARRVAPEEVEEVLEDGEEEEIRDNADELAEVEEDFGAPTTRPPA